KTSILSGKIDQQSILTEAELSEYLETSRTPIRDAVTELINEGLLIRLPRKGFKVRTIEDHELEQIIYLRHSIEKKGLLLLIKTITDEEVYELYKIISQQETAISEKNRIKYIELDQQFHRKILVFSEQNLLERIFQELYNLSLLIGHAAIMNEGRTEEVVKEHKEIIESLQLGDENAALAALERHLTKTKYKYSNTKI